MNQPLLTKYRGIQVFNKSCGQCFALGQNHTTPAAAHAYIDKVFSNIKNRLNVPTEREAKGAKISESIE